MTPFIDVVDWFRGRGLEVVLIVLAAVLLMRLVGWLRDEVTYRIDDSEVPGALVASEASKHRHALAQILSWILIVVIWMVATALVLNRLGLPFASLVAPLTAGGVALGLGAQRLVQDLLNGAFIIAERQYGFGDLVHISSTTLTDGATGTVEDVTLRVTRLRTASGELVVIPNGQVLQVTNLSSEWARATVDLPLPVGVDVGRANNLLREVGAAGYQEEGLAELMLDAPTVLGVESFELGQVNLRMIARTLPGRQFEVERRLRDRIAEAFQREGIGVGRAPEREAPDA